MKRIFVALVCALLLVACSQDDYTNVIPANSKAVVYFDLKSIAVKSGIGELNYQNELLGKLNSSDSKNDKELSKYIEDPTEIGLDFGKRIYGFYTANDYFCITAKMNSESDFEEFLEFVKKQGLASAVTEKNGVKFAELYGSVQVAFNDNTCLFSMGTGNVVKNTLARLLSQSKEESFAASTRFEKLVATNKDIALLTSLDIVPKEYVGYFRVGLPETVDNDKICFLSTLNFDNGEIVFKGQAFSDVAQVQKMLDEKSGAFGKLEGTFFSKVPYDGKCSALAVVSCASGEKLLDFCRKIPALRTMLIGMNMNFEADAMLKSAKGDIQFTAVNADNFLVQANVSDVAFAGGKESYRIEAGEKSAFVNVKDKVLKISNGETTLNSASKFAAPKLLDAKSGSFKGVDLKKKSFFAAFMVSELMTQNMVQKELSSVGMYANYARGVFNNVDAVVLASEGNNDIEFHVMMKDSKINFLKQIWK